MTTTATTPLATTPLAIVARGLTKRYGDHTALDHIDLDLAAGGVLGILGPNGAGKSTLVRLLSTRLRPDAGSASVFGHDLATDPDAVRNLIAVTGQEVSVDTNLTATENLVLTARLRGFGWRAARSRASVLLEEFDLADVAGKRLSEYSGGMRRRLDLAASLVERPPLLFLDEPTTGLDPRTRNALWRLVRELVAEGTTVVLTTQYLEEADHLADRIMVVDHGRIVADGTAESLKASIGNSSLRLRLDDLGQVPTARGIVAAVLGYPAALDSERELTAPMADPHAITDLLIALRQAGISPSQVQVTPPSLDEVFLALTGHPTSGTDSHATTDNQEHAA